MHPATLLSDALGEVKDVELKTLQLFNLRETTNTLREEIAGHEAAIYDEICSELDESTGKPVYSNDGARKAAALKRQLNHVELVAARNALRSKTREAVKLEAAIATLTSSVSLRKAFLHGGNFVPVIEGKAAGN